jgi:catechol 2,3-dioxygenase-like lactoylglutathione lyase family enzyme
MLVNAPVAPTIPVVDLERASKFYQDKLGLKPSGETLQGKFFEAGNGTQILLYQREPTKADHTVLGFNVQNIEQEVKDLREKGIVFEEYDLPNLKTTNGIAIMGKDKAAWFKDTEGNILALSQIE